MEKQYDFRVKKVAVVCHNYNVRNCYGLEDYSEHFSEINRICDNNGCDTILYALFTWDKKSPAVRNHQSIFHNLRNVQCIMIEEGSKTSANKTVEVWQKGKNKPKLIEQRFAKAKDFYEQKKDFMWDTSNRVIGNGIVVVCGESNIAGYVPKDGSFKDDFGFNSILKSLSIQVVFNPLHDYMTRYEMKRKRAYYSREGRTVITVWNQGKKKGEGRIPWTVFHNGNDITEMVREIPGPIPERSDIRIGIVPDII